MTPSHVMRVRIVAIVLAVLAAARARGDDGVRLEIEQSLGGEADGIVDVLPATVECIVARNPDACGIREFRLAHVPDQRLRALFDAPRIVVSRSGRGDAGEIRVEFLHREGVEGGVVYFKRRGSEWKPVYVTLAVP